MNCSFAGYSLVLFYKHPVEQVYMNLDSSADILKMNTISQFICGKAYNLIILTTFWANYQPMM